MPQSKERKRAYAREYYKAHKEKWVQDREHKKKIKRTWWDLNKEAILPPRPIKPCPICGKVEKLVQDHNHETDTCRSYVCFDCNCALGLAHENPYILIRMVAYLNEWSTKQGLPYKRTRYIHKRGPRQQV